MTKGSATREQIQRLVSEGYYFRKKSVQGHTYITARRGDKEQSLGPFNKDNWDYIQSLTKNEESSEQGKQNPPIQTSSIHTVEKIDIYQNELNQLRDSMLNYLGVYKVSHCLHVREGWYCQYWKIIDEPLYLAKLREMFGKDSMIKVYEPDGSTYWKMRATGFTCRDCTAFIDERTLSFIKEQLILNNKK